MCFAQARILSVDSAKPSGTWLQSVLLVVGFPILVRMGLNQGRGCGLSSLDGGGAGIPSWLATGGYTALIGPDSNGVLPHITHVPLANAHES